MQAVKSQSAQRRRLSIFIADDIPDTVMTLAAILRDDGHTVYTCASGLLAVEAIQRCKPDVCILDLVMPGKNGFAIARQVLALDLPKRPMLIAISAVFGSKSSDKMLAETVGFDYFLQKPADPGELLFLLDSYTGGDSPSAA